MKPPGAAQLPNDAGEPAVEKERTSPEAGPVVAKAPTVPDYELLRRIGGGAYGEVWLARSKATGALRAAKIVRRARFEDERPYRREFEGIQRFEKISREHPSQLALFHIGRNDVEGYFYYVMELADPTPVGDDVRSHTSSLSKGAGTRPERSEPPDVGSYNPHTLRADLSNGPLPAATVLEIGLALSEALAHLHQHGLIHRDVKPSNVIFVNGRPKLADIGLVTDASDQCSIVGTEGYLPPEGPGTPQADIFALGKVLYEAATGLDRRSFPELPEDLCDWPEHKDVVELNEIVLRACAKEAAKRYSTCQDMHDELERLGAGCSVKGRRVFQQRVRLIRKSAVIAVVVILVVAGAFFLWRMATGYREPAGSVGEGTEAPDSHDDKAVSAYRLGLSWLRHGTPEGFRQAVENFGKAIKIDPKFVKAHARLFESYLLTEDHGVPPVAGTTQKLDELSATLEKLAPTNAETHAAAGIVRFLNEWRWNEAEKEFKEALRIDPNCRMALMYYGYFLTRLRRSDEARAVLGHAKKLYPAPDIEKGLGDCEYAQRHFEDALDHYLNAEGLDSVYPGAFYWAGRACIGMTNYAQAFLQLQKHEILQGADPVGTARRYQNFRQAVEKDPEHGFWAALIEEQKPNEATTSRPYMVAARYARLPDKEQAQKWLKMALAKHDTMENLLFDDCWDPYRREKWFKEVVKEVGLEPWQ
jgi:tetratricopeptide (TPR) repeat protein